MSKRPTRRRGYKAPPPEEELGPVDSDVVPEVTEPLAMEVEEVNGCADRTEVDHENDTMQVDDELKGSEEAGIDEGDAEPTPLRKKRPLDSPDRRSSRFSLDVKDLIWKGVNGLRKVPLLNHLIPQKRGEASAVGAENGHTEEIHATVVGTEGEDNGVMDKSENEHSEEGKRR